VPNGVRANTNNKCAKSSVTQS